MKAITDLASLPENKRIELIARTVADGKQTVAVILEDDAAKIARYERKLNDRRPGLLEIERLPGLTKATITLRVKPKTQNVAGN